MSLTARTLIPVRSSSRFLRRNHPGLGSDRARFYRAVALKPTVLGIFPRSPAAMRINSIIPSELSPLVKRGSGRAISTIVAGSAATGLD